MPFKIDVREDGTPVRWETDDAGATPIPDPDYEPALYAAARNDRTRYLDWLADALAADPKVTAIEAERWYRSLDATERSPVLRISLDRLGEVRQLAREIRVREREAHAPGVLPLYDVDLDPQFRYCLDTGRVPTAGEDLQQLSLSLPTAALADEDPTALRIDGEPAVDAGPSSPAGASTYASTPAGASVATSTPTSTGVGADGPAPAPAGDGPEAVRAALERALTDRDPDVLLLSSADLVPLLSDLGVDLGRRPGYRRLAGESTFVSYGQVGHSPARYDVPGRAIVDRSNSFLLSHSSMAGLAYFVEETGKPLQEVATDSIGGVLTALEIRIARERDVLAPWQKRQTERFKSLDDLHAADRGGFTFQPELGGSTPASDGSARNGVHEDVYELDFASLYPNIIRTYDVSPETVCCDCHDTADVPELGYSLCPDAANRGPGDPDGEGSFLGDVLGDLLDDRRDWKERIREASPESDTAALEAKVEAVKWVLVSCFGYQGYRHAKFGRIETHEAINAVARDVMLTAKAHFEAAGWRVVHGIVDSLWVAAASDREQRPIREVAAEVTDDVEIELEYEGRFDWIAFCPRKQASGAAVMRYFGRWADRELAVDETESADADDRYKLRGIEARQRSTCAFVADAQRDLLEAFDRDRAPEVVCARLARHLAVLRRGTVPAEDLLITQRVTQRAEAYEQSTRAKAALQRAAAVGLDRNPGQDVRYVVVDDDRAGIDRVRLALEIDEADAAGPGAAYDPGFYADRLVRAAESVLGPMGWDRLRIRRFLDRTRDATLSAFAD